MLEHGEATLDAADGEAGSNMSTHSCLILSLKELAWTRPQDDCLLALLGGRYLMPWQMMVVFLRLMKSLWLQSRLYSNAGS